MKKNLLIALIPFLFCWQSVSSQATETFESSTVGNSTFTNGAFTANLTPSSSFKVGTLPGNFGYLSSTKWIENPNASPCSITSSTNFKVGSLYLYPSTDFGSTNQTSSVSVTFIGKLGGVTQFTYTPPSADFTAASWSNSTNRGFSLVNFATPGYQNIMIDELVTDIGGSGNYIAIDNFNFTPVVATPTITTSGTLTAFSTCSGTASTQQSFSVSGANLSANLVVTAPTGFEVSTSSGSGYSGSVSLTPSSGTVSSTSIFVRLTSSASGSPSGNVTCTSTSATTQNVAASGTVTSTVTPAVSLAITDGSQATCTGSSVTFTATPTNGGGSPTYDFRVNGSSVQNSSSATYTSTSLTNGQTVTCVMTANNTCQTSATANSNSIVMSVSGIISLTANSQTNLSCFGGSNGAATVNNASGGTAGYTYDWTPGTPTGDGTTSITGLNAGTWTCTVTDANGCTATQEFTITEPALLTADSPSDVSVCDSYTLPALTVGNYFTAANGAGTALTAGDAITATQTIYVYASNGTCTDENSFDITITNSPTADAPGDVSVCNSYTLPALTVGNYFTEANGTGTALTAGDVITTSQTIYVYAANGSCSDENSFDVTITATPDITSTLGDWSCSTATLTLEAIPTGGTINWFNAPTGGTSLFTGTSFITPSIASTTTYYAEVSNGTCVNATRVAVVATIGGCAKIQASQCGTTITNVNTGVWSKNILGATDYKFEITDPSSNVTVLEGTSRNFKFSQFAFSNNTTYSVRVAAKMNGVYSPFDLACDVRFEYQSKIHPSQCGATISNQTSGVFATAVPGATAYKFEITDPNNNISYVENTSRTFSFSQFAFVNNTTYNVRVSAKTGSVYAEYGASCSVRIEQTSKIQISQCGVQIATNTTNVWSRIVTGATGYRFELTDQSNNVTILDNPTRSFKFNQFAYIPGEVYSVRVSAKTGSYYAIYGTACNVTAPSSGARPEEVVELKSINEPTFDFEAFPNPSNGDFTISASEAGTFNIINELGQLLRTVEITEANGNQERVENMPNGAYFVTGTLNGEVVTKKVMVVR